jgi:phosphotransferase system enzyme I (PtsI)
MKIGVMIETPAAAIMADELAQVSDFFSIGSNDLCQYTLAADRQNKALEYLLQDIEPVMRLISHTAERAHRHGIWVGICGELAADTSLTERFIGMGIDELSVSAPYILQIRERILDCNI